MIGLAYSYVIVLLALIIRGILVRIWVLFIVIPPVCEASKLLPAPTSCEWVADMFDAYPLGLLFKKAWGAFLLYSASLMGANFEDLILLDELNPACLPEPIILMGIGWKSNCCTYR